MRFASKHRAGAMIVRTKNFSPPPGKRQGETKSQPDAQGLEPETETHQWQATSVPIASWVSRWRGNSTTRSEKLLPKKGRGNS